MDIKGEIKRRIFMFHANQKAYVSTIDEQLEKVVEEANEVMAAGFTERKERVIEEAWDCIQACEGLLRKYPLFDVMKGLAQVKVKCYKRGDYFEDGE